MSSSEPGTRVLPGSGEASSYHDPPQIIVNSLPGSGRLQRGFPFRAPDLSENTEIRRAGFSSQIFTGARTVVPPDLHAFHSGRQIRVAYAEVRLQFDPPPAYLWRPCRLAPPFVI